jgi:hypothetical protein
MNSPKGLEGRIDDAAGGWKGRGLWITSGDRTPWHKERRQRHEAVSGALSSTALAIGRLSERSLFPDSAGGRGLLAIARVVVGLDVPGKLALGEQYRFGFHGHEQRRLVGVMG